MKQIVASVVAAGVLFSGPVVMAQTAHADTHHTTIAANQDPKRWG